MIPKKSRHDKVSIKEEVVKKEEEPVFDTLAVTTRDELHNAQAARLQGASMPSSAAASLTTTVDAVLKGSVTTQLTGLNAINVDSSGSIRADDVASVVAKGEPRDIPSADAFVLDGTGADVKKTTNPAAPLPLPTEQNEDAQTEPVPRAQEAQSSSIQTAQDLQARLTPTENAAPHRPAIITQNIIMTQHAQALPTPIARDAQGQTIQRRRKAKVKISRVTKDAQGSQADATRLRLNRNTQEAASTEPTQMQVQRVAQLPVERQHSLVHNLPGRHDRVAASPPTPRPPVCQARTKQPVTLGRLPVIIEKAPSMPAPYTKTQSSSKRKADEPLHDTSLLGRALHTIKRRFLAKPSTPGIELLAPHESLAYNGTTDFLVERSGAPALVWATLEQRHARARSQSQILAPQIAIVNNLYLQLKQSVNWQASLVSFKHLTGDIFTALRCRHEPDLIVEDYRIFVIALASEMMLDWDSSAMRSTVKPSAFQVFIETITLSTSFTSLAIRLIWHCRPINLSHSSGQPWRIDSIGVTVGDEHLLWVSPRGEFRRFCRYSHL